MSVSNQKTYWQQFMQSGQISDYLKYRQLHGEEPNPRRRIVDSSRNKNFYE